MSVRVCLVLEGTYPYVKGGVSACVAQLLALLPNISFSLVFIGVTRNKMQSIQYRLPSNVTDLQEIYLFDETEAERSTMPPLDERERWALSVLHRELHERPRREAAPGEAKRRSELLEALKSLFPAHSRPLRLLGNVYSEEAWHQIVTDYKAMSTNAAFLNFVHGWRAAHLPIYRVLSARLPRAAVYHSMCTGYAGLTAALAARQHGGAFLLTEHGLYARERAIEIADAKWLDEDNKPSYALSSRRDHLRDWWTVLFNNLSRLSYEFAAKTTTLCESNRAAQIAAGARRESTTVIPNGIGSQFLGVRRQTPPFAGANAPLRLAYVGRVVPIKDVKTLIKAMLALLRLNGTASLRIVGPLDEEPAYAQECMELVETLGLGAAIEFTGPRPVKEIYASSDCLILSSLSEAQPLVILEAASAGLPIVATDVGACREMLEGGSAPDRLLGPNGLIVPIADPEGIAAAVMTYVTNPDLWLRFSDAGMKRVSAHYSEDSLADRYRLIYQELAGDLDASEQWGA